MAEVFTRPITHQLFRAIENKRRQYNSGDSLPVRTKFQADIIHFSQRLQPTKFIEELNIIDPAGEPNGYTAPRWFVHLMGLRHPVARVVLFNEPGDLLLQERSGNKPGAAGSIDISAGGHVKIGESLAGAAAGEMGGEVGLSPEDIFGGELFPIGRSPEIVVEKPANFTVNREINFFFGGVVRPDREEAIKFNDGEVSLVLKTRVPLLSQLRRTKKFASSLEVAIPLLETAFRCPLLARLDEVVNY